MAQHIAKRSQESAGLLHVVRSGNRWFSDGTSATASQFLLTRRADGGTTGPKPLLELLARYGRARNPAANPTDPASAYIITLGAGCPFGSGHHIANISFPILFNCMRSRVIGYYSAGQRPVRRRLPKPRLSTVRRKLSARGKWPRRRPSSPASLSRLHGLTAPLRNSSQLRLVCAAWCKGHQQVLIDSHFCQEATKLSLKMVKVHRRSRHSNPRQAGRTQSAFPFRALTLSRFSFQQQRADTFAQPSHTPPKDAPPSSLTDARTSEVVAEPAAGVEDDGLIEFGEVKFEGFETRDDGFLAPTGRK